MGSVGSEHVPSGPGTRRGTSARTRAAFGRVVCLAGVLAAACQVAGPASPVGPRGPVVAPGPITDDEQRLARELYEQARTSLDARRYLEALRTTAELLDRYPASDVSGPALLLSARAEHGAGEIERADAVAEQYLSLLPPNDPRAAEVRLLQAEILSGQPAIQLDRLLRLNASASIAQVDEAAALVSAAADTLPLDVLEVVVDAAPRGGPASAPAYARLAVQLLARGEEARANEFAMAAIEAGAEGSDLALVEGVARGELPDSLRPERTFEIGTVLPLGGPPALAEYAGLVSEGVEVAVSELLGPEYSVTVSSHDDQADPFIAAELVAGLDSGRVAGVIGLLQDETLVQAARARTDGLPLVSPTARSADRAGEGVYSLEGADRQAAEAIAHYAISRALQRVAIIHPAVETAAEEADAFATTAAAYGIQLVGRFPYPAAATHFEVQLKAARDSLRAREIAALGLGREDTLRVELLQPVGIFMPIPAEDVEFVAPQFAHFGLDTLAIEILGTSGWTDAQILEQVDPRLLEGIVATAAVGAAPGSPGQTRFRTAYETHFRRSLVSPTPALGYDAALLLLEALRPGRLRPEDVHRAFNELADVEGANGIYSVVDGRVVRRTEVVVVQNGQLVPVPVR